MITRKGGGARTTHSVLINLFVSATFLGANFCYGQKSIKCEYVGLWRNNRNIHITVTNATKGNTYTALYCHCSAAHLCLSKGQCQWQEAPCAAQTLVNCTTFRLPYVEPSKFDIYGLKLMELKQGKNKADQRELFVMDYSYRLKNCFSDHKPTIRVTQGQLPNSVDISWSICWYDKQLSFGRTVSVTEQRTGKLVPTSDCTNKLDKVFPVVPACTIKNLIPCKKYRICVALKIYWGDVLPKQATTACQSYVVPTEEIHPPRGIDTFRSVARKVTRFSWLTPNSQPVGDVFYMFNVRYNTMEYAGEAINTTRTSYEVRIPRDVIACIASVRTCLPCSCSKPVSSTFKNCGSYSAAIPQKSVAATKSSSRKLIGIVSGTVFLLVAVMIIVILVYIRRMRKDQIQDNDDRRETIEDEEVINIIRRDSSQLQRQDIAEFIGHDNIYAMIPA